MEFNEIIESQYNKELINGIYELSQKKLVKTFHQIYNELINHNSADFTTLHCIIVMIDILNVYSLDTDSLSYEIDKMVQEFYKTCIVYRENMAYVENQYDYDFKTESEYYSIKSVAESQFDREYKSNLYEYYFDGNELYSKNRVLKLLEQIEANLFFLTDNDYSKPFKLIKDFLPRMYK